MPRSGSSPDVATVQAVIPIAVFTLIDAGTAWSSPFQRTPKNVHDALEPVTTKDRNNHKAPLCQTMPMPARDPSASASASAGVSTKVRAMPST